MAIRKVSIEEGCIACNLCMDLVPEVFLVNGDQGCVVKRTRPSTSAARPPTSVRPPPTARSR
jgi:ferredoxin